MKLFTLMMLIMLVVLGGVYGLRLNGVPDTDLEQLPQEKITYMSIGVNEPLKRLKISNDELDKFVLQHAKRTPFSRRLDESSNHTTESMKESDGFFDDPDELWAKRKQRHINQMSMQDKLMTTCPDGFYPPARKCLVGCVGKEANCDGNVFWQTHYEPSFSCTFEERVGLQGEGGKWVCDPYKIRTKEHCLVYSVGSNGQYDFEEGVHNHISPKCEIHTVDMNNWTTYTSEAPPKYVTYHVNKIGPEPNMPMDAFVRKLGHKGREIDIFKIDCEGCEWQTYKSWFGEDVYIRQILVEIHGTGGGQGAHDFFNTLFDMGYVVFHKEPNTLGCGGSCVEYAFVKLTPKFSRTQSIALP